MAAGKEDPRLIMSQEYNYHIMGKDQNGPELVRTPFRLQAWGLPSGMTADCTVPTCYAYAST